MVEDLSELDGLLDDHADILCLGQDATKRHVVNAAHVELTAADPHYVSAWSRHSESHQQLIDALNKAAYRRFYGKYPHHRPPGSTWPED